MEQKTEVVYKNYHGLSPRNNPTTKLVMNKDMDENLDFIGDNVGVRQDFDVRDVRGVGHGHTDRHNKNDVTKAVIEHKNKKVAVVEKKLAPEYYDNDNMKVERRLGTHGNWNDYVSAEDFEKLGRVDDRVYENDYIKYVKQMVDTATSTGTGGVNVKPLPLPLRA